MASGPRYGAGGGAGGAGGAGRGAGGAGGGAAGAAGGAYGGNPYGDEHTTQAGPPYPQQQYMGAPMELRHQNTTYSQASSYSQPSQQNTVVVPPAPVMSNVDFLRRVDAVRSQITALSGQVSAIATAHQRAMSAPDSSSSSQVESLVSQTQVLNTQIRDQIRLLETDAARSGGNATKDSQIRNLKSQFTNQLNEYRQEEQAYKQRYQEQIARQYRIVNPDATEDEVREASEANWGDEGVFQTALRTNRSAAATSVLGAVRARHNDIQKIERTMLDLNQLFSDLAETVLVQEPAVQAAEEQTTNVVADTENAAVQLTKGVEHARRARKLKWWCLGITVLILAIVGLVLGLVLGLRARATTTTNNNNSNTGTG